MKSFLSFFKFSFNTTRLVRMFTFSWCYCMIAFIQVWAILQMQYFNWLRGSPCNLDDVYSPGVVAAILVALLPMVFLGVFPAVILEAALSKSNIKELMLDKESWHERINISPTEVRKTLCSHCWLTAVSTILFGVIIPWAALVATAWMWGMTVIMFCRCIVLGIAILFGWWKGWELEDWSYIRVYLKMSSKAKIKLSSIYKTPELKEGETVDFAKLSTAPPPGLLMRAWFKFWDTLVVLKQRACPIIKWTHE